jgi:fucose permease
MSFRSVLICPYFSGGNVLCLDLWGRNSGPFMQALHFSFGLGAFVAPLLAAPFLEATTTDVSPSLMASTVTPFQVSHLNGMGVERGKREASQNENNRTGAIRNVESLNDSFHEFTTESLENVSKHFNPEIPVSVTSILWSVVHTTIDGPDANDTTVQPIATTHRAPKPKPSKTNASSLGNKNWDAVHVGVVPKEDLQPGSSTTTTSASTTTSTTASATSPFISYSSKLDQLLMLQAYETTSITNGTNTNPIPNPIQKITDVTGSFGSINKGKDGDYSEIKMGSSVPNTVISTAVSPAEGITKNLLTRTRNTSFVNINGSTYTLAVDYTGVSSSTEGTVPKSSVSAYLSSSSPITTHSYEELLKTHAYTSSKIAEEFVPSIQTEDIISQVRSGDIQHSQSHAEYISNMVSEKHRTVSSTEQSAATWIKEVDIVAAVSDTQNTLSKRVHHSKPVTYDNDTEEINSLFTIVANRIEKYGFSKVQFTYLMVGLFEFVMSLVFLGFLCHNPRDAKSKQEDGQGTKKISNRALQGLLISLMAVFYLLYVGLEVTYGQLVLAFAVHGDLHLAQSSGLVIAVAFWGSFAAMRFASIFFSSGFGPMTMLILNFVFCTVATVLLSTMASHMETALWVGTALLGIGLASIFPTGILWIERYIHVSNKVAAAFVMGASLGEMVCPVVVYQLMVINPAMLMHSAVVINVLCIGTFVALRWLALRHGEKYCAAINNGYQLASQEEEEEMIDTSPSGSVATSRRRSLSEHRALLNGNTHRGP